MKYTLLIFFFLLALFACEKEDVILPIVLTGQPVIYSSDGVEFKGELSSEGNQTLTEHGFLWTETQPLTLNNSNGEVIRLGVPEGTGYFNAKLNTGFAEGKTYYIRAFASTTKGTAYGSVVSFKSLGSAFPVIDSIVPGKVFPGDTMTIFGKNFFTLPGALQIVINSVPFIPDSVNNDRIYMVCPEKSIGYKNLIGIRIPKLGIEATSMKLIYIALPVINIVKPLKGTTGDNIVIYGDHFVRNSTKVWLNNKPVTLRYNAISDPQRERTEIHFNLPPNTDAGENSILVSVFDANNEAEAPNTIDFLAPYIDKIEPAIASIGDTIKLTGKFYSKVQSEFYFTVGDVAGGIVSADSSLVRAKVPVGINPLSTDIILSVRGRQILMKDAFTAKLAEITSLSPQPAGIGDNLFINGHFFAKAPTDFKLLIGNIPVSLQSTDSTVISANLPLSLPFGQQNLLLTVKNSPAIGINTCMIRKPSISDFYPETGTIGDTITIPGYFPQSTSTDYSAWFGNIKGILISKSKEQIKVKVPVDIVKTPDKIHVRYNSNSGDVLSSVNNFITAFPTVSSINPQIANRGDTVTIDGIFYTADPGDFRIVLYEFNCSPLSVSPYKIIVKLPDVPVIGSKILNVYVRNYLCSPSPDITIREPEITGISPAEGTYNDIITMSGDFSSIRGAIPSIFFGDALASLVSFSESEIRFKVPESLNTTDVQIKLVVSGTTITAPGNFHLKQPEITNFSPVSGGYNEVITITGQNFNPGISGNMIDFGGYTAEIISAGANAISFRIPPDFYSPGRTAGISLHTAGDVLTATQNYSLAPPVIINNSGTGLEYGEDIHLQILNFKYGSDEIMVDLSGTDLEVSGSKDSVVAVFRSFVSGGDYQLHININQGLAEATYDIHYSTPWQGDTNYPEGRLKNAMCFAINGKFYVGGGFKDGSNKQPNNALWELDPQSMLWTQKRDVPVVSANQVNFTTDTRGYYIVDHHMYVYDPVSDIWVEGPAFPGTANFRMVATGKGNKGYVGMGSEELSTNIEKAVWEMYEYNETTEEWAYLSKAGTYFFDGSAVWLNNKLYLISKTCSPDKIFVYNFTSNKWTYLDQPYDTETPGYSWSSSSINNRIFLDYSGILTELDENGNKITSFATPLMNYSVVKTLNCAGSSYILLGTGATSGGTPISRILIYDPTTN